MRHAGLRAALGLAGAAAAAVALIAGSGSAAAAGAGTVLIDIPAAGGGFTATPVAPLLQTTDFAPGKSVSGVLGVRNGGTRSVAVDLRFVHVIASDDSCAHGEAAIPGACDQPGQLAQYLVFTLAGSSDQAGPYSTIWTGSAAGLVAGVPVDSALVPGGTDWFRLTESLPPGTGDEVETDTYGFTLRIDFAGPGSTSLAGGGGSGAASSTGAPTSSSPPSGSSGSSGSTGPGGSTGSAGGGGTSSSAGVGGVRTSDHPAPPTGPGSTAAGPQGAGAGLAETGVPVLLLAMTGLVLVGAGLTVLAAVRRRRGGRRVLRA